MITIRFLKSTDDSMLDTLQKMSGTTHRSYIDSKTITTDGQRLFMQNESKLSYTMTTKEVPVISYNDMAFIAERNSIVFRAGDAPVWNRNQTILPMSWRLFSNTIVHAGHEYTLQTIPTLSSALDFDVRKNQPDFTKMLNKRMGQAYISQKAKDAYKDAYGYSDYEIEQIDPDNYADDIMNVINEYIRQKHSAEDDVADADFDVMEDNEWMKQVEVNTEQLAENQKQETKMAQANKKIYAHGFLSREDLFSTMSGANHSLDNDIITAFVDNKGDFEHDTMNFIAKKDGIYARDGHTCYIMYKSNSEDLAKLQGFAKDKNTRVFDDAHIDKNDVSSLGSYVLTDDFYRFLVSFSSDWTFAKGRFSDKLYNILATK